MRFEKFAEVDGYEVLVDPGFSGEDQELFIKDGENIIAITISSGEYENDYGEFFFRELVPDDYKDLAYKIMEQLSCKKEQVGSFLKYMLKPEYEEKIIQIIEKRIKEGRY